MKKHKQTLQSQRDMYFALMGEEPCGGENECATLDELNEAIDDCYAMLQYSIDQNNKEEISYWRKLLQENKVQRRALTA